MSDPEWIGLKSNRVGRNDTADPLSNQELMQLEKNGHFFGQI